MTTTTTTTIFLGCDSIEINLVILPNETCQLLEYSLPAHVISFAETEVDQYLQQLQGIKVWKQIDFTGVIKNFMTQILLH